MDIKTNINKIDYDLSSQFQNFKLIEKSSLKLGNYFEIEVRESKNVRIVIPFKNIDGKSIFEWYYYSNPLLEDSELIPRVCKIEDLSSHIKDIITNKRFSEDYKNINE